MERGRANRVPDGSAPVFLPEECCRAQTTAHIEDERPVEAARGPDYIFAGLPRALKRPKYGTTARGVALRSAARLSS